LNAEFFLKFEMIDFTEAFDPDAEKIENKIYPGFFIIKARKK
jgi:hypothetical protein